MIIYNVIIKTDMSSGGMVHLTIVGLPYSLHLFHNLRLVEMPKSTNFIIKLVSQLLNQLAHSEQNFEKNWAGIMLSACPMSIMHTINVYHLYYKHDKSFSPGP